MAVASWSDKGVFWFDVATGELLHVFPAESCTAVAFSPTSNRLALASQNEVLIWDLATRQKIQVLRGHSSTVDAIVYSPDGRLIATGGRDRKLLLWNAKTGEPHLSLNGHRDDIWTLAFSPDGRSLVSGDQSGVILIWQATTGQNLLKLNRQTQGIHKVSFSPDGQRLAFKVENGRVYMIDVK